MESFINSLAKEDSNTIQHLIYQSFSNWENLNKIASSANVKDLSHLYSIISTYNFTLIDAITTLLDEARLGIQAISSSLMPIVILLFNEKPGPAVSDKLVLFIRDYPSVIHLLAKCIQESKCAPQEMSTLFKIPVFLFQHHLNFKVETQSDTIDTIKVLALLAEVNEKGNYLAWNEFYNASVQQSLDLKEEYPKWKNNEPSICNYPFLLNTETKGDILRIESMVQMRQELQDSFFRAMFIGVNSPYLQLEIRRDLIIRDTLFQLEEKSKLDLRKQLKINFAGEEGIDEGGIQKEFFQLVSHSIFDSKHGMFESTPNNHFLWFCRYESLIDEELLKEYKLLGQIIGLAIYNGVTLDLKFPLAFYKKILGICPKLPDLADIDDELHRGFSDLLSFTGNVEETYLFTFQIQVKTVMGTMTHNLLPQGDKISVNNENRMQFVQLYIEYLFDTSMKEQFDAFYAGFSMVMDSVSLKLFKPEELMELVIGSASLDFSELENSTKYDGFTKDSPTIINFWKIVNQFDEEHKRKLLFFATGSEKVPIGGLSKLQFTIARNGVGDDRIPTAHTCFNVLMLCEYSNLEMLEKRLLTSLKNSNCGFFLN